MSDQMVYYIELKGKVDDLQGQLERLFKDITERSKKAKDDIDNGLQPPPIEKYNKYIEAKKKLDGKSKTSFEEYEKAKTTVENAENDKRLKSYIDYKNREDERSKKSLENMKKLGTALTLGVTAPITAMAVMSIKSAGQMEKYTATLKTMLGSEEAAFKRMEEYKRIAASTPFELKQVVDAGNQLQALNEYSEETLINLGDLAAASGKPLEQVMNAYAKLVTGQKGEAINMFRDMLIAQSDWVDANGKALETTEEMLAELPKILERKSFVGMMEEQSKTFEGQMSNLKDSITNLGASFGEILLPTVKIVVSALTSAVDGFKNLDDGTKKIIIGIAGVAAIAGPTILAFTKTVKTIDALRESQTLANIVSKIFVKQKIEEATATVGATTATKAFNLAMLAAPVAMLAAVAAVGVAVLAYARYTEQVQFMKNMQDDLNNVLAQTRNSLERSNEKLIGLALNYEAIKSSVSSFNEAQKNINKEVVINDILAIKDSLKELDNAYQETEVEIRKNQEIVDNYKEGFKNPFFTPTEQTKKGFQEANKNLKEAREKQEELSNQTNSLAEKYAILNLLIKDNSELLSEANNFKIVAFDAENLDIKPIENVFTELVQKNEEQIEKRQNADKIANQKSIEDIIRLYNEYLQITKRLEDNKYDITKEGAEQRLKDEEDLQILNNNKLLRAYIEINKEKEKADKDAFEKKKSDYDKYVDNIKKIESNLLSDSEKEAYESENRKLQANYEAYKNYLEKQKEIEKEYIASPERLSEYVALKNQLYDGDFENLQEYNELEKKEEDIKNDYKIESYIEYLKNKKFLTDEEKRAFLELKEYEKRLEDDAKKAAAEAEAAKEKAKKDDYSELISGIGSYAESIITNFELAANATDINYAKIANTIGSINKSFLSVSDGINSAISTYSDFSERIEKESDPIERSNLKIAQTVSLIGDAAKMAFDAMSQVITAVSQAFAQETERQLAIVEQNYQDTLKSINDMLTAESDIVEEQKQKRLQALKDEMAERGIIIETGYETELEKAEEAHQEALDELNEFQDDENKKRLDYLEAYRESLVGRTDAEIEEALRQKENELKREREQKELNLRTIADERAAEVEKQKIIEESKKKQLELDYNAKAAEVQAENEAATNKHAVEVDAFEKQKGLQIAMAWINLAAGTVGAFAQGIAQLGPIAGSIVGAVASTLLTGVTIGQTVAIASQAPPSAPIPKALPTPPKFASGGIIPGNSVIGDNVDIKANSGEMILNRDQQQSLFNMINDGTLGLGGNQNVNVTVVCYIDSSQIPIKQKLIEIQRDEAFRK